MSDSDLNREHPLNTVLKYALTGINQYFLHARMLKHAGMVELADFEYKQSLGTMKHADMLVDRVLSLGGAPNLQDLGAIFIGKAPADMLANDLRLEEQARDASETAHAFYHAQKDEVTAALLAAILKAQREHIEAIRRRLESLTKPMKECA